MTDDLHRVHRFDTLLLLFGLAGLYAWLRQGGLSNDLSALLALLYVVLPASWLLALSPQSEFLYLPCSLLALTCLAAHERKPQPAALALAALFVALAGLSRSVGLCLCVPLILQGLRASGREMLLCLTLAMAPPLGWLILHRSTLGYASSLGGFYGKGGISAFAHQLGAELPALRRGFVSSFSQKPELAFMIEALGLVGMLAAGWRCWQRQPDALYLASYLALLLIWPYPDEAQRLLWPILPVLLAQPLLSMGGTPWQSRWGLAVGGIVLGVSLPAIAAAAERYRAASESPDGDVRALRSWYLSDPIKAQRQSAGELMVIAMLRQAGSEVPATACIIAVRPELVEYFSGRLAAWPVPADSPEQQFRAHLQATHCRYVFATTAVYAGYPEPLYPLQRLGDVVEPLRVGEVPRMQASDGRIVAVLARLR